MAVAETYIRRRSAHIEAKNFREARQPGDFQRAHHAAGRSRKHGADGLLACFPGRHETAVRLHDGDRWVLRAHRTGALQLAKILVHERTDVGVDQSGGGALVLAEFGADIM